MKRVDMQTMSFPTGTYKATSASNKAVKDDTVVDMCSLSLEAGVWVVNGSVQFPTDSKGIRWIKITNSDATGNSAVDTIYAPPSASKQTIYDRTVIYSLSSTNTVKLKAWQNSTSSLTCSAALRAVRIK